MAAEAAPKPTEAGSSNSANDSLEKQEVMKKASELLAQGKKLMVCGEIPKAVKLSSDAVQMLVKEYGEMSRNCADAYFSYGSALLELGRMETNVLGVALEGVDVENKDDEAESEQFEKPPAEDGEERHKLRTEVYDAMAEGEREKELKTEDVSEQKKEKTLEVNNMEGSDPDATKTEGKPDDKVAAMDIADTVEEEGTKEISTEKTKEISTEKDQSVKTDEESKNKTSDQTVTKSVEKNEPKDIEEKENVKETNSNVEEMSVDETPKEVPVEDANKGEMIEDSTECTKSRKVLSETEKNLEENLDNGKEKSEVKKTKAPVDCVAKGEKTPEKKIEVDEIEELAKPNGDADVEWEKEDEGEAVDEEEDGEETAEGEEEEDGEGDKSQDADSQDEDIPNFQLAWENLDLANVIYKKSEAKEEQLKAAECHIKLGELSMETEQHGTAAEDLNCALKIQQKFLSAEDRLIAETHYQLGLAYGLGKEFELSIEQYQKAITVIEAKIASLNKTIEENEKDADNKENREFDELQEYKDEIKELQELIPEMKTKIEDTKSEAQDMEKVKQMAKEMLGLSGTSKGFGSPTKKSDAFQSTQSSSVDENGEKKATDISSLMRKKRKPEDEVPASTIEVKKIKQDGDSSDTLKQNGHYEDKVNGVAETKVNGTTEVVAAKEITSNGDATDTEMKEAQVSC